MNIHTLITVTNKNNIIPSTLLFDTLRVGFPTASVKVWNNFNDEDVTMLLRRECKDKECEYESLPKRWHHARWIQHLVETQDEAFTILDGDIIFYASCEDFEYQDHISGYYIPVIWNEWAQCVSYERLHTSFLMVAAPQRMRTAIRMRYPAATNYNPLNPYMPCVGVSRGTFMFWDSCSMLFNMLLPHQLHPFTVDQRARYAHVNSASFYDTMLERTENKEAFELQHQKAKERDYAFFRQWHLAEDAYYLNMHHKGMAIIKQNKEEVKREDGEDSNGSKAD